MERRQANLKNLRFYRVGILAIALQNIVPFIKSYPLRFVDGDDSLTVKQILLNCEVTEKCIFMYFCHSHISYFDSYRSLFHTFPLIARPPFWLQKLNQINQKCFRTTQTEFLSLLGLASMTKLTLQEVPEARSKGDKTASVGKPWAGEELDPGDKKDWGLIGI